jgi:hypothetical protein
MAAALVVDQLSVRVYALEVGVQAEKALSAGAVG